VSSHDLKTNFRKVSHLGNEWRNLLNHTPDILPFLSYEWFDSYYKNILESEPEIMVFSKNGNIVGIIPGVIENQTFMLLGDSRITDINDIIYLPGFEEDIIKGFSSYITNEGLHIDLFPVKEDSILIKLLPGFLEDLSIDKADLSPILTLSSSWDKYLKGLSGKARHELRRKLRKAKEVYIKNLTPNQVEILFQLMSDSDSNKRDFLSLEIRNFFREITKLFFDKKWLRLQAAFLKNHPIGVLFAFQSKKHVYLYNTGYNPDFHFLSPGIVTIGLDIRDAIEEGFNYYDFLRGGEDFKFQFGAKERYTMRITG